MPRRRAVYALIAGFLMLPMLAACDKTGGTPLPSPSAPADPVSSAPSTSPTTPSPSPSPSLDEQMLHAAQTQVKRYYKANILEGKDPSAGPSKSLLAMTDPEGPERIILKKSFANARKAGSHVVTADIRMTVGPETASDGSRHTQVKFRACIDGRRVKVTDGTRSRHLPWELLDVEMRAKQGTSIMDRSTEPAAWLVYRLNDVDKGSPCGF